MLRACGLPRNLLRRRLGAAVAPLVAVPFVLRACGLPRNLLLTRCDGLAFGALLAALLDDPERVRRHARAFRLAFAGIALAAFSLPAWGRGLLHALAGGREPLVTSLEMTRVALADFGLVGLIACESGRPWLVGLRSKVLCYLGRISFGLYMYHPLVFITIGLIHPKLGIRPSVALDVFKALTCIVVASLSWRFLERPILTWKDRLGSHAPHPALAGPHFVLTRAARRSASAAVPTLPPDRRAPTGR